ncbi:MAG: hypothetical protein ABIL06_26170 [Pseudomonadota bacterium]
MDKHLKMCPPIPPTDMGQKLAEDALQQEDTQTLQVRAQRFLKVKPHGIVPYTPFAPVSAECISLFQDGHFYGCIALTQSVAEAIARFLCQKNAWEPDKSFEKNIKKLSVRKFISVSIKNNFLKIWKKRDDYHHLNPNIETDRFEIEKLAYEKILFLNQIESEIFKFSISDEGKLIPDNKKYWNINKDGTVPVFLKIK